MNTELGLIITDAGLAEIINAEQSGTAPVVLTEVGFGKGKYTPTGERTRLDEEFKRISAISGGAIGDTVIHLTVSDASADDYDVFEVGVYTASGTLFAIYSQNTPIIQKAGASEILLALDFVLTNVNPDSVTIGDTNFILTPATTSRQGIVELATGEETIAGSDSTRAITPSSLNARTATVSRTGLVELATVAEAIRGVDGDRAITPNTLKETFVKMHLDSGYQKMPNGFIVQWGKALIANGEGTVVTFPTTFPSRCTSIIPVSAEAFAVSYIIGATTSGNVTVKHNGNGGVVTYWIAVGYQEVLHGNLLLSNN